MKTWQETIEQVKVLSSNVLKARHAMLAERSDIEKLAALSREYDKAVFQLVDALNENRAQMENTANPEAEQLLPFEVIFLDQEPRVLWGVDVDNAIEEAGYDQTYIEHRLYTWKAI